MTSTFLDDATIERAARASHAATNSGVERKDSPLSWESESPGIKEWHRKSARAALQAVLAPESIPC